MPVHVVALRPDDMESLEAAIAALVVVQEAVDHNTGMFARGGVEEQMMDVGAAVLAAGKDWGHLSTCLRRIGERVGNAGIEGRA